MKRILIILMASLLLAFGACAPANDENGQADAGYKKLLDVGIKLPSGCTEELVKSVIHPSELAFDIEDYKKNGKDYMEMVCSELNDKGREYAEKYGDDWKLSYEIKEAVEKDAKGIEQYKQFDSFYFERYGIPTDEFRAVTFVKVKVHIEGSKGSADKDRTIQCFQIGDEWYSLYAVRMGLGF